MLSAYLVGELTVSEQFFRRTISVFTEADGTWSPGGEDAESSTTAMPVAAQVMHVAQSIDWFIEGAYGDQGFDMNFDRHMQEALAQTSLQAALDALAAAFARAKQRVTEGGDEGLWVKLPDGPIMGGQPRLGSITGVIEHTAHHRGSLSTYARLLGKVAPMPYG